MAEEYRAKIESNIKNLIEAVEEDRGNQEVVNTLDKHLLFYQRLGRVLVGKWERNPRKKTTGNEWIYKIALDFYDKQNNEEFKGTEAIGFARSFRKGVDSKEVSKFSKGRLYSVYQIWHSELFKMGLNERKTVIMGRDRYVYKITEEYIETMREIIR